MKNLLVTGGAGYIGAHTCKALAHAGFAPVTFDNLAGGHRRAVRWGPLIEADMADQGCLERVLADGDIEGVIHFAGLIQVGESVSRPGLYYRSNVTNTLTLLDAMVATGVKMIVFSSSAAVYGHPQSVPIAEDHPERPLSPYGESKLAVERALHWYGLAHGLRWTSLRYFNAAGADSDGEIGEAHDPETHLIPLVIDSALGRRPPVQLFGADYPTEDGTAVRDYVHVSDLADAHVVAFRRLADGGTNLVVNVGTGIGISVRRIIDGVSALTGHAVPYQIGPRRPGDPSVLVANNERARAALGWTPRRSDLQTILTTALAWHRRQEM